MNLILFAEEAPSYRLPARDPRFEHVRGVLRMAPGDTFAAGVANGRHGTARVVRLDRQELEVAMDWENEPPPPPPPVHLLLALPRPATARKVLFDATTLGVSHFHFFAAEKGDPGYTRSALWTEGKWRQQVWAGAEQAFSTHVPEAGCSPDLASALATLPAGGTRRALDVYEAAVHLGTAEPPTLPLVLALGGERGWSARERTRLRDAGFDLFSLGQRVLRVETAVVAALALSLGPLEGYSPAES